MLDCSGVPSLTPTPPFRLPDMFIINYFQHNRPRQDCRDPLAFSSPKLQPTYGESGWSEQKFLVPEGKPEGSLEISLKIGQRSSIITMKALQSPVAVHGKGSSLSLFESPLPCSACFDHKNAENI